MFLLVKRPNFLIKKLSSTISSRSSSLSKKSQLYLTKNDSFKTRINSNLINGKISNHSSNNVLFNKQILLSSSWGQFPNDDNLYYDQFDSTFSNLDKLKVLTTLIVQRTANSREFTQKQLEIANDLCNIYYECTPQERFHYLCFLSEELCTTVDIANSATTSFVQTQSRQEPFDPALLVERLLKQVKSPYQQLFRCISRLQNGVKFLVDFRGDLVLILSNSDLMAELSQTLKVNLRIFSTNLSDLLSMWFTSGFLRLERITWHSPTSILQKISEYEAVHPIRNWLDLKHRLGLYRRCYTFSHSCLEGEPLVILHVALVPDISSSIQDIIRIPNIDGETLTKSLNIVKQNDALSSPTDDHSKTVSIINGKTIKSSSFSQSPKIKKQREDPNLVDAAIFYSISSTQKGLSGIDLGNQLIKKVAAGLKSEFPLMTKFSSLSPIPNFTEYLLTHIQAIQRGDDSKGYRKIWERNGNLQKLCGILSVDDEQQFWNRMIQLLRNGNWITDQSLVKAFKDPLMTICAYYLYHEKRRGFALNPVANFHLRNGAVLWRLNWLADISTRGLSNSCGMMVNYRYYLEKHHENTQIYLNEKRMVIGEQFEKWIS